MNHSGSQYKISTADDAWFGRPQYRPKVENDGEPTWFLSPGTKTGIALDTLRALPSLDETNAPSSPYRASPEQLIAAIEQGYSEWELPRHKNADANLRKLADPAAVCVVTGQQPGFLGGPLYVVYKALSAIALAEAVEAKHGVPCAPIFWVAGDDHDIDEVRAARFPQGSESQVFRLAQEQSRRSLRHIGIDQDSLKVLDEANAFFEDRRFAELAESLISSYRGRNVASGFAAMIAKLLGPLGLIVLDPEQIRPLAQPMFEKVARDAERVLSCIEDDSRALQSLGLRPFVKPRLPLFVSREGERHHLSPAGENLRIDGSDETIHPDQLLQSKEQHLTWGALLRPLIQDGVLPCVATIGGPAECGYFSQLGSLANFLEMKRPRIALRLHASLVLSKAAKSWRKLEVDLETVAESRSVTDLTPPPKRVELDDRIDQAIAASIVLAGAIDGSEVSDAAQRKLAKSVAKSLQSLEQVRTRFDRERRESDDEKLRLAQTIWNELFPGDSLQERYFGWLGFVASHGTDWIDDILAELRTAPLEHKHRIILSEDFRGQS